MNTSSAVPGYIVAPIAKAGHVRALRGPRSEEKSFADEAEFFLELPWGMRASVIAAAEEHSTATETIRVYDDKGTMLSPEHPRP